MLIGSDQRDVGRVDVVEIKLQWLSKSRNVCCSNHSVLHYLLTFHFIEKYSCLFTFLLFVRISQLHHSERFNFIPDLVQFLEVSPDVSEWGLSHSTLEEVPL
jgi:hypothetical protein